MAAILACGDGAVLSHRTAAAVWGLRRASGAVEVTVESRNGRERRAGIALHRGPLPAHETALRQGLRVTSAARTLLDLAAVLSPRDLNRALEDAERLRIFDLGALRNVLADHPHRPGTPALARALGPLTCPEPTRSELELLFLDVCEKHGIPRPTVNAPLRGYEVDFLWRAAGVIVEVDGAATHATRAAFERDRARDADLTAAGYRVLRFTHRRIAGDPVGVAKLVLRTLGGRPARPRGRSGSASRS